MSWFLLVPSLIVGPPFSLAPIVGCCYVNFQMADIPIGSSAAIHLQYVQVVDCCTIILLFGKCHILLCHKCFIQTILLIIVVLWLASLAGAHVDRRGAFSCSAGAFVECCTTTPPSRCKFVECSATVSNLAGTIVYCCPPQLNFSGTIGICLAVMV
jgi:hypothetical protein